MRGKLREAFLRTLSPRSPATVPRPAAGAWHTCGAECVETGRRIDPGAAAGLARRPVLCDLPHGDPCRARAEPGKPPRASRTGASSGIPIRFRVRARAYVAREGRVALRVALSRHPQHDVMQAAGLAWHICSPKFASIRPFGIGRRMGTVNGVLSTLLRFILNSLTNGGLPLRQPIGLRAGQRGGGRTRPTANASPPISATGLLR
jgi:hypothetical protein